MGKFELVDETIYEPDSMEREIAEEWNKNIKKAEQEEKDKEDIQEMLSLYRKSRHIWRTFAAPIKLLWRAFAFLRRVR